MGGEVQELFDYERLQIGNLYCKQKCSSLHMRRIKWKQYVRSERKKDGNGK